MAAFASSSGVGSPRVIEPSTYPRPLLLPSQGTVKGRFTNLQGRPLVGKLVKVTALVGAAHRTVNFFTDDRGGFQHSVSRLMPLFSHTVSLCYQVYKEMSIIFPAPNGPSIGP